MKHKPLPRQTIAEVPARVGLFSSRAPHRPNPIALSALQIKKVDKENGTILV